MTDQNRQLIAGIYAAFGRGDLPGVLGALADDVDWNLPGVTPYSGHRKGRAAVQQFFADLLGAAKIEQFEVDTIVADGENVVVLGRERCTATATGTPFEQRWAHAFTVRDGKVTGVHLYEDTHAQAAAFPAPQSAGV